MQVYDAISAVKTWEETIDMIPGWRKNRLSIEGTYWKYDDEKNVWVGRKDRKRRSGIDGNGNTANI